MVGDSLEGISVGRDTRDGVRYVRLNYKVRNEYYVTGWHYHSDTPYLITRDMEILDDEILIAPKCLIEW